MNRRQFIERTGAAVGGLALPWPAASGRVMTVTGWRNQRQLGFTLPHEHVLVDFVGADRIAPGRYQPEEVFRLALPKLLAIKQLGAQTFIDCTPSYLGRDVTLLRRLAQATGLNLVTNTGYYGAAGQKFLPAQAYTETAEQTAARWVQEWQQGIDGTGIRPGFMKIAADDGPLSQVQRKMVEAAALAHQQTGLSIGMHCGGRGAAQEALEIVAQRGVAAAAFIWIHAQNEGRREMHLAAARAGAWVEFDGMHPLFQAIDAQEQHLHFLQDFKREGLLHRALISQDAGWYNVGQPEGGKFSDFTDLFTRFLPLLRQNGFTQAELDLVFNTNPYQAFGVRKRLV
jgi:phosphotriesterase-related protein